MRARDATAPREPGRCVERCVLVLLYVLGFVAALALPMARPMRATATYMVVVMVLNCVVAIALLMRVPAKGLTWVQWHKAVKKLRGMAGAWLLLGLAAMLKIPDTDLANLLVVAVTVGSTGVLLSDGIADVEEARAIVRRPPRGSVASEMAPAEVQDAPRVNP